ncbi:hypothetical protein BYT27DRAFT_7094612, partial [Phlegmacium glaucopus]
MTEYRFVDPIVRSHYIAQSPFHLRCFSTLQRLIDLFLHVSAKLSRCYCSPFWQLLLHPYILPLHHISVTCRRIALSLIRNQCSRHDFLVHVFALSVFWSALSPHPPLQHVRTHHNKYYIVYGITVLVLTSNLLSLLSSALGNLRFSTSECLCIPLCHRSRPLILSTELHSHDHISVPTGGGRPYLFPSATVAPFITQCDNPLTPDHVFRYMDHVDDVGCLAYPLEQGFVYADLSLTNVVPHISKQMVQKIARIHKVPLSSHWHLAKDELVKVFEGHNCINCNLYKSVLDAQLSPSLRKKVSAAKAFAKLTEEEKAERNNKKRIPKCDIPVSSPSVFPPPPLTKEHSEAIIRNWCKETKPSSLEESGCAVCGELVPISKLSRLKAIKKMLGILAASGVTRIERKSASQAISEFKGPVLDYRCDKICDNCRKSIRKGRVPRLALANNLWLGEVPNVLSNLNYVERLLVARIRHNCCFVKVASSGLKKMVAHVIAFESPLPKVYH